MYAQGHGRQGLPSIAELTKAVAAVPGSSVGESTLVYKYFKGTVQPTAPPAFRLGEAIGARDVELSPHGFGQHEVTGLLFLAAAGRYKEFVLFIAELHRLHPHIHQDLLSIIDAMDFVYEPASYRQESPRDTAPLLSDESRRLISRCCHTLLKVKNLKLRGEQGAVFGSALHAATDRFAKLSDKHFATRVALFKALSTDLGLDNLRESDIQARMLPYEAPN